MPMPALVSSMPMPSYGISLVLTSAIIWLKRVESSSTESNMLHLGRIWVRKSKEAELQMFQMWSISIQMTGIQSSGVK